jgi:7-carboxy-7-deazaguanine synthase
MKYRLNNLYTCVQGEGSLTGTAMVLVRLHGCGVGCVWCDTKETWDVEEANKVDTLPEALGANPRFTEIESAELVSYVKQNHKGPRWILLTGGEPAEQPLQELVEAFHAESYRVALETSGTADGLLGAGIDWVCVSPKIDNPAGKAILKEVIREADELKFIVGREADISKIDRFLAEFPHKENALILLQPLSVNPRATKLCIETVQERGWRLSLQTHKYLNLP